MMSRKIKPNGPYYLIGEITPKMAIAGHLPAGPIFITPALYDHIRDDHPELVAQGVDIPAMVHDIMENFTEIRKGRGNSFILVRRGLGKPHVAAIGLVLHRDSHFDFWIGKTAWITSEKRVQKKPLATKTKSLPRKAGRRSKR